MRELWQLWGCGIWYNAALVRFADNSAINRLDAPGIIAELKWLFPSHTMPFFTTLTRRIGLKGSAIDL